MPHKLLSTNALDLMPRSMFVQFCGRRSSRKWALSWLKNGYVTEMYFELFRNYSLGLCRRLGCGIFIELWSYQWFFRKFESFNENSIGNYLLLSNWIPVEVFFFGNKFSFAFTYKYSSRRWNHEWNPLNNGAFLQRKIQYKRSAWIGFSHFSIMEAFKDIKNSKKFL